MTRRKTGPRGDSLSTAAGIVTDRVRASDAYHLGREAVIQAAIEAVGPSPTVARLRDLGGITEVVRAQIAIAATPGLDDNLGSLMFPLTPRSLLAREASDLRTKVQQLLAAGQKSGATMKIRYLKITLVDGTRFILRVTGEAPGSIQGFEVDAQGDEVVPPGWENRWRLVERDTIAKTTEMRMNNKYATLEVVPGTTKKVEQKKTAAQLDAEIAETLGKRSPR